MLPLWSKLCRALRDFGVARSGNVAIIFAISTLPLAGFVGAAIDYSRANNVKAALQTALDSTALMLSKEATTDTSTQLQDNATKYFNANFSAVGIKASSVTITPVYSSDTPTQITVKGAVSVPTAFVAILGVKNINLNESSTTAWGSTRLRVALVLDNTGSMADAGKLTALKTATSGLLDQFKAAASVNGDVYVSIIPFVKDVNVGACGSNCASETWLDFSKDYTNLDVGMTDSTPSSSVGPGSACPYSSWTNGYTCVTAAGGSTNTSSIPSSGTNKGWICPSNSFGCYDSVQSSTTTTQVVGTGWFASCWGYSSCTCTGSGTGKVCTATVTNNSGYSHTWFVDKTKWTGCVFDRGSTTAPGTTAGHDQDVVAPTTTDTTTLFPAVQYGACPQQVMGLSYDWASMKSLVTNMVANGSTNQPIGLMMGWLSLTGGGPFSVPAMDSNYTYQNIIILLSDGLNTQDRWYGNGSSTNTSVDDRMLDSSGHGTCANIKAAGVTIYTIQVNTGGDPQSTLLRNCASDTTKFWMLTSASQIATTFTQIGTNLTQLRVAK